MHRRAIEDYHAYHGDRSARVVKKIKGDALYAVYMVSGLDEHGERFWSADQVFDGDVTEMCHGDTREELMKACEVIFG